MTTKMQSLTLLMKLAAVVLVATRATGQVTSSPRPEQSSALVASTVTVAPEKQSAQVSASGGARGVGPDRLAKGGDNPNTVKVTVSAAELDAFKKGIA